MENIDRLVQLVTDRLLESFQVKSEKGRVYLIGGQEIATLLTENQMELTTYQELADWVVVDKLCRDALLRVASLCPTSEDEVALLTALLSGKKVLVSSDCFDIESYRKTATNRLYREMLQQKSKLEGYGIRFYRPETLLQILISERGQEKRDLSTVGTSSEQVWSGREGGSKLITESRLRAMDLAEGDVLKLEKGTIVTALAKDYIQRLRIKVE